MGRELYWSVLLAAGLCGQVAWSQAPWRKAFGAYGPDEACGVRLTAEGNIVTAGSTGSFGNGSSDAYIVCVSGAGELLWTRAIGGPQVDHAQSLVVLDDGSLVFAGYSNGGGSGGYDGWLVKTDHLANVEWERFFGGTDWDLLYDLTVAPDGGFLLSGTTFSSGAGSSDGWLLRTDADGEVLWSRTFGGTGEDELRSASVTNDGGTVVAGAREGLASGADVLIAKLDAEGVEEWSHVFGTDSVEFAMDVIQTLDGGYSIVGTTRAYQPFNEHLHLRLDANGDSLWSHDWGQINDQEATEHVEMPNGEMYTVGYTETSGGGAKDMFIFKSDTDGNYIFQYTYGGTEDEMAASLAVAPNGFIIAGKTNSFGAGGDDVVIVRTDSVCGPLVQQFGDTFDPTGVATPGMPTAGVRLYPNPANGRVHMNAGFRLTSANLFDPQGRLVRSWSAPVPQELDLRGLGSGLYQLLTVGEGNALFSQPLIIAGN